MSEKTILSEKTWEDQFNPINESPVEHSELQSFFPESPIDPLKIWTLVDVDDPDENDCKEYGWVMNHETESLERNGEPFDNTVIVSGFHIMNKIGYFVCEKTIAQEQDYEVLSDDLMEIRHLHSPG